MTVIFHILKDILVILWCCYIDFRIKLNIEIYHDFFDKYHHISPKALTIGERYKLHNLTVVANRIGKRYHMPRIHIYVLLHDSGALSTARVTRFRNEPYNIMIGRSELDQLSFDCLKVAVYHEIGHYFAPNIIFRHHLCKCLFIIPQSKPTLTFRLSFLGWMSVFIPYGWIFSISLMLYTIISVYLVSSKRYKKHYSHYRHWCEIIADEFALSITHNMYLMTESIRQEIHVMAGKKPTVSLTDRETFQDPESQAHFEALNTFYTKAYLGDIYNQKVMSGDEHPSFVVRIKHMHKFAENNYKW